MTLTIRDLDALLGRAGLLAIATIGILTLSNGYNIHKIREANREAALAWDARLAILEDLYANNVQNIHPIYDSTNTYSNTDATIPANTNSIPNRNQRTLDAIRYANKLNQMQVAP